MFDLGFWQLDRSSKAIKEIQNTRSSIIANSSEAFQEDNKERLNKLQGVCERLALIIADDDCTHNETLLKKVIDSFLEPIAAIQAGQQASLNLLDGSSEPGGADSNDDGSIIGSCLFSFAQC